MRRSWIAAVSAMVATGLTVVTAPPAGATTDFDRVTMDAAPTAPTAGRPADIDGDGDLDLLVSSFAGSSVTLYRNDGTGAGWTTTNVTSTVTGQNDVAVGDIDGDGDLDAVQGGSINNRVAWSANTAGDGTAWADTVIDTGTGDGVVTVETGDMDGDGDLDVVVGSGNDDELQWYENLGAGAAWSATHVISAGGPDSPADAVVADIDADGDMDVATASIIDDTVSWYSNGGDGTTWTAVDISVGPSFTGPNAIAAGDVDGDGDLDLTASREAANTVSVFLNDGTPLAGWTTTVVGTGINAPREADFADFDLDGDLDIISSSLNTGDVFMFENTAGDATAWSRRAVDSGTGLAIEDVPGDFDGDGDVDVVAMSGALYLEANQTIHAEALYGAGTDITTTADLVRDIDAGDLDGDGDPDLAIASGADDAVRWIENDAGDASAWTRRNIDLTADEATAVAIDDVDGDGDLDVVESSFADDTISWYANDGAADPSFAVQTVISAAEDGAVDVATGDLDGDGDLDAVSAGQNGARGIWWHENTNAAGNGSTWTSFAVNADLFSSVLTVDIDRDGDLDIVATDLTTDSVVTFRSDGANNPTFGARTNLSTPGAANLPIDAAAADVDGDGDIDVAAASQTDDEVSWFANNGSFAAPWTQTVISAAADAAQGVRFGDVDQDGDLDAVSTSFIDDTVSWYENTAGTGTTWVATDITTTADAGQQIALADLDRDGDLDIAGASQNDDSVTWYENDLAQLRLTATATAPATTDGGTEDDVFSFVATHLGDAADHDEELTGVEVRLEEAAADPMTQAQAEAAIDELNVYRENGAAGFDGTETQLVSTTTFAVDGDGDLVLAIPDVAGGVIAFGSSPTFYVTASFANASSTVRISFNGATSTAEDDEAALAVPLRLRAVSTVSASIDVTGTSSGGGGGSPRPDIVRRGGVDRYETAAAMTRDLPAGIDVAYVATGEQFPDALATGPVAGIEGAALLLATRDSLPDATAAALTRLRPDRIVVVGGTAAISDAVADQLGDFTDGSVRRVAGVDRYGTAAMLSHEAFPNGASIVHVVGGNAFADAIGAGPVAARQNGPILLVAPDGVPQTTIDALDALHPTSIVIVGGTGSVSTTIEAGLDGLLPAATVTRVGGTSRYATSAALCDPFVDGSTDTIYVATGRSFADALTATPAAVGDDAVILLVPSAGTVPAAVLRVIEQADQADLVVVGGTAAVSDEVVDQLR